MLLFKNDSMLSQVNKILKQRGIADREKALALRYSNSRTEKIKRLNEEEIKNLLNTLYEFTDETLLKTIYESAFSLKIIPGPIQSTANDELIISYLKAKNIIDFSKNEIDVVDPVRKIKITTPFSQLNFVTKELLLSIMGDIIIELMAKNN